MKILKVLFLIVLFLALAGVLFYQYGPEDSKKQVIAKLSEFGLSSVASTLSGKKAEGPKDELMTKKEDFYVWKDDKGCEHYEDSLASVPAEYRNKVKTLSSDKMDGSVEIMTKVEQGKILRKIESRPPPEQMKGAEHKIFIYSFQGDGDLGETKDYFEKFNMPYTILDVIANPEYAAQLKMKLGLDINKKYSNINFPVVEIDGQIIERIVEETDKNGKVTKTSLNTAKINKIFGLRSTFE